jgi:hypothetical protein
MGWEIRYSDYIMHYTCTYCDNHALLIFAIKVYEFQNQVSSDPDWKL